MTLDQQKVCPCCGKEIKYKNADIIKNNQGEYVRKQWICPYCESRGTENYEIVYTGNGEMIVKIPQKKVKP